MKNPKCTKTHGGRGFAPDRGDPWPTGRAYSAPRSPSWWVGVYHHSQEPHPGSASPLGFELTLPRNVYFVLTPLFWLCRNSGCRNSGLYPLHTARNSFI